MKTLAEKNPKDILKAHIVYRNKATEEKLSAMLPLVSNKRTYIHIWKNVYL